MKKAPIVASIIIAGALIAGAMIVSGGQSDPTGNPAGSASTGGQGQPAPTAHAASVRPVSENDHILGNPNAKVSVVEFSDFECPFCARLHPTLARIVEENSEVNWAYRHFPLSIHRNARSSALASECAASLGGNEAFWAFSDGLFANQRSLGEDLYLSLASQVGLDQGQFQSCLDSNQFASEVSTDENEAVSAGGRGTPFAVVLTASGRQIPFSGALPYDQINGLVNQALSN